MVNPAPSLQAQTASGDAFCEQPLSERMRTFLRLEFLYRHLSYSSELDTNWATRAVISTLLEIMAILSRGDVRSEVLKELDLQLAMLERYQHEPDVDGGRLESLIRNLSESRDQVTAAGTGYLQPLKDCEFLSAIKHRSAIPGGTCEFDLPEYCHWLRQSIERRREDMDQWIGAIHPLCDAVTELLWLIRESAQPVDVVAEGGMYQHAMQRDVKCQLLRVILPAGSKLYPEISGSQHRFTVRFLEWSTIDSRATQTNRDVPFRLAIC